MSERPNLPAIAENSEHSFFRLCFEYARGKLGSHPQLELTASILAPISVGVLLAFLANLTWSSIFYGLVVGLLSGFLTLVATWITIFLVYLTGAPAALFRQKENEALALRSLVKKLETKIAVNENRAQDLRNLIALHAQGSMIFDVLKTGGNARTQNVTEWYAQTVAYLERSKGPAYATEFISTHNQLPPGETYPQASVEGREICATLYPKLQLLMNYIRALREP
jgi:hypothetical protein